MGQEVNNVRQKDYSEDDQITAYIAYQLEGHNASAVERVTNIPAPTIRRWVKRWNEEGYIPGESAYVDKTVAGFIGKATKIRDMALEQMEKEVKNATNLNQLITVVDKLDNKIRLAKGQATNITEERQVSAAEVGSALEKYLNSIGNETIERHEIVIDADFEEQVLGIEAPKDTPDTKE